MNKPAVTFDAFIRELKGDLKKLVEMYPPGPTVYDIQEYYGESRWRAETAVQHLEDRGVVGRVLGAGRKIHVILADDLEARRHDTGRLTTIQSRVLSNLVLMADDQGTREGIKFTIQKLADMSNCSPTAVQQALKRLAFFQLIGNMVKPEPGPFESTLDLKIAS